MVRVASTAASAPARADLRARDQDRDRCIEQLQDAYVDGALTRTELDERLDRALSACTRRQLADLLVDLAEDLPDVTGPSGRRQRGDRVTLTLAAAVLALLGVVGVGTANSSSQLPDEGQAVCVSTGLAGADVGCPALTKEQAAVEQSALDAAEAASQAESAVMDSPGDSPAVRAAVRARNAAQRAEQAVIDAQVIVATAPHQHPKKNAFVKVAREARRAAAAAAKAAEQAEG